MIESLLLPNLTLGIGISMAMMLSPRVSIHSTLIAAGLLMVAILQLGVPPIPPISSKHKIIYLLLIICLSAPLIAKLPPFGRVAVTALIILMAFFWLNWRRFSVGLPPEPIFLSVLTNAFVLVGIFRAKNTETNSFLWPAGLFVTLIASGVVGLLSGYLGLGQLALGVVIFLGGILLVPYVAMFFGRNSNIPAATSWVFLTAFGVLGVSLASFATNLHPLAYGLLLVTLLSPLVAERMPPLRSAMLSPLIFGAVAAVPAICAMLVAFVHF